MDPPDIDDEVAAAAAEHAASINSNSSSADTSSSAKRARTAEPSLEDFYFIGRDIQNRFNHRVGAESSEDVRFRSCFGCGAHIALLLWQMLSAYDYLPDQPATTIAHLLWALFFMMVYPSETVLCGAVGGDKGVIDPKTIRKYIWPIITAIASLEQHVVSIVCSYF